MIKHYSMKKQKKSGKNVLQGLQAITDAEKELILNIYYFYKVSSQNMINSIYYHAGICRDKGQRGKPGEDIYGLLTTSEH